MWAGDLQQHLQQTSTFELLLGYGSGSVNIITLYFYKYKPFVHKYLQKPVLDS